MGVRGGLALVAGGRYAVVGGAGFIGSHFVDCLLSGTGAESVTVYDNHSSGRRWHYAQHAEDPRFHVIDADVIDGETLVHSLRGNDTVIHLASNPDIAKAATEPAVDFNRGTLLTHHVLEASRIAGVKTVLYASGSGVYGDIGAAEASEDRGPLLPISTYGASKIAGETLLCAYSHMFGLRGRAFRFGNVVGSRQTHGVGLDFVKSLLNDPNNLRILGDGSQSKPYVHVADIVDAVLGAAGGSKGFDVFNVATDDHITVTEIAGIVVDALGLDPATVRYAYAGGDRGWKGDVPVVRLSTDRIRATGWRCRHTSGEAMRSAVEAIALDARAGRL
jgi:UDP-glucose 4-epimerase